MDKGRLNVDDLAERFRVTTMTIRRDLDTLEEKGVLIRTHGGCVPRELMVPEMPFADKKQLYRAEKHAIARAVVGRVLNGMAVYLDTGTTCETVATLLAEHRRDLTIFTSNIPVALAFFGHETCKTHVLGGVLGSRSPELSGQAACNALRDIRLDIAIVGADAIDIEAGEFYSAEQATAVLSQTAQARADAIYLCVDSTKFNKHAFAVAGRLDNVDILFTDGKRTALHLLEKVGGKSEIVQVSTKV